MRFLPIAFAIFLFASIGIRVPDLVLDHDEVEHLHAAWLVSKGLLPYRDFAETHNPVLWYALAPLLPSEESPKTAVSVGRITMLICSVLTLLFTGLITYRFSGLTGGILAPLFLLTSSYWMVYAISIRPDVPMTTFVILAFYLSVSNDSNRRGFLTGLVLGFSVAILTKALPIACVFIVMATIECISKRHSLKPLAALVAGTALPVLVLVLMFFVTDLSDDAWTWLVRVQAHYMFSLEGGFGIEQVIAASMQRDLLPWAGLLAGTVRIFVRPSLLHLVFLALVAIVIAGSAFLRLPNYQYLYPAIVFMAIMGADAIAMVVRSCRPRIRKMCVTVFATLVLVLGIRHVVAVWGLKGNDVQLARMQSALSLSRPEDTVVASPPVHPIFRRDALYIWFNNPELHLSFQSVCEGEMCERYKQDPKRIRKNPPAIIIKTSSKWHSFYGIGSLATEHYCPSPDPEILVICNNPGLASAR